MIQYGPKTEKADQVHMEKYRQSGETFAASMTRIANHLKDGEEHYQAFREILLDQRFLPAGRVQASCGASRQVTPFNCFVSQTIPDSMEGIMEAAKRAAITMRYGGGIGYDFSTLRPKGDHIKSLDASSSGPISFMEIFNSVCSTVASAGNRRGAQMGVLRVDHPDVEEFIRVKQDLSRMKNFNLSVAVIDKFMKAVEEGTEFPLQFEGVTYKSVNARQLWDQIMQSTWDYAEPGVLFIDRINEENNLNQIEILAATNPCAEQPLPPNGACLLGSLNLVKYLGSPGKDGVVSFNMSQLIADIPHVIRGMDNIIDRALYPLPEQEQEAKSKRRMGIGVTGVANTIEAMGHSYGSEKFNFILDKILEEIGNQVYLSSTVLAEEKGTFPLYNAGTFNKSFTSRLRKETQDAIYTSGLRNSHLLSIAPTGTISMTADNVSSGIEPVFSLRSERDVITDTGVEVQVLEDYGLKFLNVRGKTANECSIEDHLSVLRTANKWVDSSVSKTCNIGDDVSFTEFSQVYMDAWKSGLKGCTTFRQAGKRIGMMKPKTEEQPVYLEGAACYIDPETGVKTCE